MATAVISNKQQTTNSVVNKDYPIFTIKDNKRVTLINSYLPFRIQITNIGVEGYGPNNVPPIGIAIVGLNNYIL